MSMMMMMVVIRLLCNTTLKFRRARLPLLSLTSI